MIKLLYGENDYELTKKIAQLKIEFDGSVERYDASDLTNERLSDIFAGQTLFTLKRRIIVDQPAGNIELWHNLPRWTERLSDDTELILVEPKPDKRTATYKWLNKNAEVIQFDLIDERDSQTLTKWLESYASDNDLNLTNAQTRLLINKAGNDQWALAQAVDKLTLIDEVTEEWINVVVESKPTESVFALFETALQGNMKRLKHMVLELSMTEDPYRLFALLSSQVLQLAALVYGDSDIAKVARDTGAKSSYPLQKMAPYSTRLSKTDITKMVDLFADADMKLKSSDADPWMVLESTLFGTASLNA